MIGNALPIPWLRSIYSSSGPTENPFTLKIDTSNTFGGPNYPFGINTDSSYTYDYTVDWGDGTITNHTGDASHTYSSEDVYEVKITGKCPWIKQWTTSTGVNYVIDILQWGNLEFKSLKQTFKYCNSLANPDGTSSTPGIPITATDTPNFASDFAFDGLTEWAAFTQITSIPNINTWQLPDTLTSLEGCFNNMKWWNDSVADWDVSNIGNYKKMFYFCRSWINGGDDLSSWKPGKDYTGDLNFEDMFYYCDIIEDMELWQQDLYLLGINFINTKQMFYACEKWKLALQGWDNTSVKINQIEGMFSRVGGYYKGSNNRPFTDEGLKTDFFGWDFNTNKTSLRYLFSEAAFDATFNANIDGHTATNITNFDGMFSFCFLSSPSNADNWILGSSPNITMRNTFQGRAYNANSRRGLDWKGTYGAVQSLNGWDVSNVIDFDGCFNAAQFNTGPDDCKPIIGTWTLCTDPTVNVSLKRMFRDSKFNDTLVNDAVKWNTSRVNSMYETFGGAGGTRFNQSLSNWNTSNVSGDGMRQMFYYNAYFNQDISHFDLSNITSINRMFDRTGSYSYSFDWMEIPNLTDGTRFQFQWKFDTQKYTDTLNAWALYYYNRQVAGNTVPQNITMTFNNVAYWGVTNYFIAGLNVLPNGLTTRDYLVTSTGAATPGLGWALTDGGGI